MGEDQEEEEECFKKGAIVEVSLEDEGFRGSWYTATVLSNPNSKNKKKNKNMNMKKKIQVEFHTLMADDKATKPLRESVDILLLRPVPPRETHCSFQLSEVVDAFHNDGWWEGIVTDIIFHPNTHKTKPPSSSSYNASSSSSFSTSASSSANHNNKIYYNYSVFFRSSREQIVFQESDLRLHREWVHGNWVPPFLPPDPDPHPPPLSS